MYEKEGTWNFSFSGSGFLEFYLVGATTCLRERAPHLLHGARRFYGSSAWVVCCLSILSILCNHSVDFHCANIMDLAKETKNILGIYHPCYDPIDFVRQRLKKQLPDNIHEVASQKMGISLTRFPDGKNVIITSFASKEEVIQAVICSLFFPFYCGAIPPLFRGERYMDGSLSNHVPFFDSKVTITFSPFYGASDICPESPSASFHEICISKGNFQLSVHNIHHGIMSLFPPEPEVLADFCRQGYLDALKFLERCIMKEAIIPSLLHKGTSSPSSINQASNNRGTNGGSEEEEKSGPYVSWNIPHVRVRDVANFELLSPELEAALKKNCEKPSGLFARFSRSLPGQMLIYSALPYTVPVQFTYVRIKKFIRWIPKAPDDIWWTHNILKKFGSFVYSGMRDRLLGSPGILTRPFHPPCLLEGSPDDGGEKA
ncbi:patatin-like phospholipase domain-containing protein 5 [Gracilinanus agilis]|uniref:patatin-like phospholipase domain-containing protein 5 n=1 Tax=Gracilinanus agilis TaxID=191870 RepID=UPI001CFD08C3|nr:patatin-like phospholipase domain-containing protein 5 [Gracilinanus agilis]